jgi:hypothetical protein
MKDLFLVTAHCDMPEKEDVLRGLINDLQKVKESFDVMLFSHVAIPTDIARKTDYSFYDKKNELLYDWNLRSKPWFSPGNSGAILSVFCGFHSSQLACWRMIILGNMIAKGLGYQKIHHIEYDTRVHDFSEMFDNSKILDSEEAVVYDYKEGEHVDSLPLGSYFCYRIDSLHPTLLNLDEESIKEMIKSSETKSSENMMFGFLNANNKCVVKKAQDLFRGNEFMFSHKFNKTTHISWCLPYYEESLDTLSFVVWNREKETDIEITLIYNQAKTISFKVAPGHWRIENIDSYQNADKLTVMLDGRIRNHFDFNEFREEFKEASFRKRSSYNVNTMIKVEDTFRTIPEWPHTQVGSEVMINEGDVVDLGCLGWDWSGFFIGKKRVIGADPFCEEIAGAELYKGVVGPYDGNTRILYDGLCSSIISGKGHEVEMLSWKSFCQTFSIDKISILKINIEGGEYGLLNTMDSDDFLKIDQIAVSFHDWTNPLWEKQTLSTINLLEKNGFLVEKLECEWGWYLARKKPLENLK